MHIAYSTILFLLSIKQQVIKYLPKSSLNIFLPQRIFIIAVWLEHDSLNFNLYI